KDSRPKQHERKFCPLLFKVVRIFTFKLGPAKASSLKNYINGFKKRNLKYLQDVPGQHAFEAEGFSKSQTANCSRHPNHDFNKFATGHGNCRQITKIEMANSDQRSRITPVLPIGQAN